MNDPTSEQRTLTAIALSAIDEAGFALAGSGAIREHGFIDRPTEDIDLFTARTDETAFAAALTLLLAELRQHGYDVAVDPARNSTRFARLGVHSPAGQSIRIDLAMDWRKHPVTRLEIGAVLSVDDAVQGKLSALYTRAEARDFLDVDAIRRSARFTDDELLEAAADRDPGFELRPFAAQLELVDNVHEEEVAAYGVSAAELESVRARMRGWAAEIRALADARDSAS